MCACLLLPCIAPCALTYGRSKTVRSWTALHLSSVCYESQLLLQSRRLEVNRTLHK